MPAMLCINRAVLLVAVSLLLFSMLFNVAAAAKQNDEARLMMSWGFQWDNGQNNWRYQAPPPPTPWQQAVPNLPQQHHEVSPQKHDPLILSTD